MKYQKICNTILIIVVSVISLLSVLFLPNNVEYYNNPQLPYIISVKTLPKFIAVGIPVIISLGCSILSYINKNKVAKIILSIISIIFALVLLYFIAYFITYIFKPINE